MPPTQVVGAGPSCGREPLVEAITTFLAHMRVPQDSDVPRLLRATIDEAGADALPQLGVRLARAGADWDYYPHDPLVRRLHHVLAASVLGTTPAVTGTRNLDLVAGHPVVIFANHLSYSDANVVEILLQQVGRRDVADRLAVVAGPKVYSDVRRRFSSLAFATIKTPQSTNLSSEDAVMSSRDVAQAAKRSIEAALERLRLGEALLVFPEGTRSRDGGMQRLLPGVARYLRDPALWVLPVGLTGTEQLYPVGEQALRSTPLTMSIGTPVRVADLLRQSNGDRQDLMDAVGRAIASNLPPPYRGVYGAPAAE